MYLNIYHILTCKKCEINHSFKLIAEKIDQENNQQSLLDEINKVFDYKGSEDETEVLEPLECPDHLKNIQIVEGKLICEKMKYFHKIVDTIVMAREECPL